MKITQGPLFDARRGRTFSPAEVSEMHARIVESDACYRAAWLEGAKCVEKPSDLLKEGWTQYYNKGFFFHISPLQSDEARGMGAFFYVEFLQTCKEGVKISRSHTAGAWGVLGLPEAARPASYYTHEAHLDRYTMKALEEREKKGRTMGTPEYIYKRLTIAEGKDKLISLIGSKIYVKGGGGEIVIWPDNIKSRAHYHIIEEGDGALEWWVTGILKRDLRLFEEIEMPNL